MATTKKKTEQTKDEKKVTQNELRRFARWADAGGEDVDTVAARAVKEGADLRPPAGSGLPNERPHEKGATTRAYSGFTHEEIPANTRLVKKSPTPAKKLSRFAKTARPRGGADAVEAALAAQIKAKTN